MRALALASLVMAATAAIAGDDAATQRLNVTCGNLVQFGELDKAAKPCREALKRAHDRARNTLAEAQAMQNQADLYLHQQGESADQRDRQAEDLLDHALSIRKAKLGADDLAVAQTLNSLGFLRYLQGRDGEAIARYKSALAIRERSAHPVELAQTLNDLAAAYDDQGDEAMARPLYEQALRGAVGANDPRTRLVEENLARLDDHKPGKAQRRKADPD
jgi:tetratricopeptide (TPR) repeat protein